MIVVYADETGTQGFKKGGREPAPGVYGFMATPKDWEKFRGVWSAVLKKYSVGYFHFRELNPSARQKPNNPYSGWSNAKVDDFIHDMAMAASSGPIPCGGCASVKWLYGGRTDKQAHQGSYKVAFEKFFDCFTSMMDTHFPGEGGKVSFFFDDNENEDWMSILNTVIKKARKRDRRIGEYACVESKTPMGMPCQAADLFAYINRQHDETLFEKQEYQKSRLLDFIISRYGYPKTHPRSLYARYSDAEWERLINVLRADKQLKRSRDVAMGLEKRQYYPFVDNELLRAQMVQWRAEYPQFFNEYGNPI